MKERTRVNVLVTSIALWLMLTFVVPCWARKDVVVSSEGVTYGDPIPAKFARYSAWTRRRWESKRDMVTQQRWNNIQDAVETGADAVVLAKQWKERALKKPEDKFLIYAWAVADYEANEYRMARGMGGSFDPELRAAFVSIPPPYSYEYMRGRFLTAPLNSEVFRLGIRLADAEPLDYTVRWILAGAVGGDTKQNMKFALRYANELTKIRPDRPMGVSTFAWIYFSRWYFTRNKKVNDANQALKYYRLYLKAKPSNALNVTAASEKIKMMEDWLKKQKTG